MGKIVFIKLTNNKSLEVILSTLGASIFAFYFDGKIMTVTPRKKKDFYLSNIYHGKTIGPVCGRIKNGCLSLNDKTFNYPINEGQNTLHSGENGLSNQLFDYEVIKDGIIFRYKNEDAEYLIKYQLVNNSLKVDFEVRPLHPLPLALTNHAYFSLGDKDISKLSLKVNASKFIEVNKEDLIPERTKEVPPFLDFRNGRMIEQDINHPYLQESRTKGYDHPLLCDDGRAVLENENYRLTINSDFTSILIYSDNYPNNVKMIGSNNKTHRGIAIEPQDNQLERKIYQNTYKRFIEYRFEKK